MSAQDGGAGKTRADKQIIAEEETCSSSTAVRSIIADREHIRSATDLGTEAD